MVVELIKPRNRSDERPSGRIIGLVQINKHFIEDNMFAGCQCKILRQSNREYHHRFCIYKTVRYKNNVICIIYLLAIGFKIIVKMNSFTEYCKSKTKSLTPMSLVTILNNKHKVVFQTISKSI